VRRVAPEATSSAQPEGHEAIERAQSLLRHARAEWDEVVAWMLRLVAAQVELPKGWIATKSDRDAKRAQWRAMLVRQLGAAAGLEAARAELAGARGDSAEAHSATLHADWCRTRRDQIDDEAPSLRAELEASHELEDALSSFQAMFAGEFSAENHALGAASRAVKSWLHEPTAQHHEFACYWLNLADAVVNHGGDGARADASARMRRHLEIRRLEEGRDPGDWRTRALALAAAEAHSLEMPELMTERRNAISAESRRREEFRQSAEAIVSAMRGRLADARERVAINHEEREAFMRRGCEPLNAAGRGGEQSAADAIVGRVVHVGNERVRKAGLSHRNRK
jgi:hypothetical protein